MPKFDGIDDRLTIKARFAPQDKSNLRDGFANLIGRVFTWELGGTSGQDEPYPGQRRWFIAREHYAEIPEECRARWAPQEDLEPLRE